jgi:hypothetical protein
MLQQAQDGRWKLLDPYGRLVWGPTSYHNDVETNPLPLTGTYSLLIEGANYVGGTTNYRFTAHRIVDDAAALTLGTRIEGTIDHPGQTDRLTFTLTAPKRIYVDPQTGDGNLTWSLDGPRGNVASRGFLNSDGGDFGSNSSPVLDLVAGTYTLAVGRNGASTGAYAIRVLDLGEATKIIPGVPVEATLSPARRRISTASTPSKEIASSSTSASTRAEALIGG